ncbi:PspC domain-containing protein [Spirochaeta dissipatitropha]
MNLRRSSTDRVFGGVCGGIASAIGMSSSTVRLLFVLAVVIGGLSAWAYIILLILIPSE